MAEKMKIQPHPSDGFHASVEEKEGELGKITLTEQRGGTVRRSAMLMYEPAPVPGDSEGEVEARASLQRNQILADALCRYINVGGSIDGARRVLESVLANITTMCGANEIYPLIPLPWKLLETYTKEHEHVFYDPTTSNAVVWVEGSVITPTTLDALCGADTGQDDGSENPGSGENTP